MLPQQVIATITHAFTCLVDTKQTLALANLPTCYLWYREESHLTSPKGKMLLSLPAKGVFLLTGAVCFSPFLALSGSASRFPALIIRAPRRLSFRSSYGCLPRKNIVQRAFITADIFGIYRALHQKDAKRDLRALCRPHPQPANVADIICSQHSQKN